MKYPKIISLIFLMLMAACDREDESSNISPVDSVILISAIETSAPKEIILNCRTKKEYQCYNYKIVTSKRTGQKSVEINFESIKGERLCATALGPATAMINLGEFAIGEYSLSLNVMESQNEGRLIITPTEIKFEFDNQNGIEILTPIVQR
ncbi:hypothetical protein FK178_04315 [Antarcticibacterium arcticum]|uniref:Lipoprotein n=1 Tax=Antarcticibacterium arcticum TaxID=2585771 RepID=A0A5B8YHB8_9FLAO|nr:hypothetical protein [Antarcticibacterium arcticum]QED36981.1 hypothetical protein FK178_04315 [Antarcticibacterium arcticum]